MSAYGPLCTAFYDADKPHAPPDAVAWYAARARTLGGRVLEPLCGSGRFLLPLARAGLTIDGTDVSDAMLAACRRRLQAEGLSAGLHAQALQDLDLPHRYRLALIPAGSIALIAPGDGLATALRRLHDHLEPGGRLLLEVPVAVEDMTATVEAPPRTVAVDADTAIVYRCRSGPGPVPGSTRHEGCYEQVRGGHVTAVEHEDLVLHAHDEAALRRWLREAGFVDVAAVRPADDGWLVDGGCWLLEATAGADPPRP